ncbi:MAG: UvrD-helicase domain-containing protein [Clostridiales bacterium]|nr:UvrD-helicase domain-containing protein [Clostridiales bacterium]
MTLQKRFITARRLAIEKDFLHLNEKQREAVLTTEGPLLLLAGAGSGKTTVLINRITNLLKYGRGSDSADVPANITENDLKILEDYIENPSPEYYEKAYPLMKLEPVEPWRLIAITFTNKAADELKARLERVLGEAALDVWASTFHSACARILRRDIEHLGFSRSFTIYDTSDSQTLVKRIIRDLDMDEKMLPPRSVLSQISSAKDSMLSPEEYLREDEKRNDFRKAKIGQVYCEYSKRLKEANALDFDDLILFTVRLLLTNDEVREYYQTKFKYVLIDEYQDTNNLQYLLASTLAGKWQNICVVGDDDQSIYKFRGATIKNILDFENQYKNARSIRMEQNYRSTGNILDAANAVISNNTERKGKELWTNNERGDLLTLYTAASETDEAQYVASRILEGYSRGENWRDFAVLYRMNAQSNQLEYAFKRNGIPYRVIGGTRFFDRAEIKDILAYLCVINNPSDDLRLLRIVNVPARAIGNRTIEELTRVAGLENISAFETMKKASQLPDLQKSAARLAVFVELIEDLRSLVSNTPLDEFYDILLSKTGYLSMLEAKDTIENTAKIENIKELKTNIIAFLKERENGTLSEFLDEIALYTDLEQLDPEGDSVVMMTMHSAKGLEFPTVFIVGAEEGIFPGAGAMLEPAEMEEERRLCYVAMTRAKERLYITNAHHRMLFGKTSTNRLSRFVDEIPDSYIEKPRAKALYETSRFAKAVQPIPEYRPAKLDYSPPAKPMSTESLAYKKGDTVEHKAFGRGLVVSIQPMGGDALMEIAFEGAGTKRLMRNTASRHMKKA